MLLSTVPEAAGSMRLAEATTRSCQVKQYLFRPFSSHWQFGNSAPTFLIDKSIVVSCLAKNKKSPHS